MANYSSKRKGSAAMCFLFAALFLQISPAVGGYVGTASATVLRSGGACVEFETHKSTYSSGGLLVDADSLAACRSACRQNSSCVAVDFRSPRVECRVHLEGDALDRAFQSGWEQHVVKLVQCNAGSCFFGRYSTVIGDRAPESTDSTATTEQTSRAACSSICDFSAACSGFVWHRLQRSCRVVYTARALWISRPFSGSEIHPKLQCASVCEDYFRQLTGYASTGGIRQTAQFSSAESCRWLCLSTGSCRGFEFNSLRVCFIHELDDFEKTLSRVSLGDVYVRVPCTSDNTVTSSPAVVPGCRYVVNVGSGRTGGQNRTRSSSQTLCRALCDRNASCSGFDFHRANQLCYFHGHVATARYLSSSVELHSKTVCTASTNEPKPCTAGFQRQLGRLSYGGRSRPVASLSECRARCEASDSCEAFDWSESRVLCFMHFAGSGWNARINQFNVTGIDQYVKKCVLPELFTIAPACVDTFSTFADSNRFGGVRQADGDSSWSSCSSTCLRSPDCAAFDYSAAGRACFLHAHVRSDVHALPGNTHNVRVTCQTTSGIVTTSPTPENTRHLLYPSIPITTTEALPTAGVSVCRLGASIAGRGVGGLDIGAMSSSACALACETDVMCVSADWRRSNSRCRTFSSPSISIFENCCIRWSKICSLTGGEFSVIFQSSSSTGFATVAARVAFEHREVDVSGVFSIASDSFRLSETNVLFVTLSSAAAAYTPLKLSVVGASPQFALVRRSLAHSTRDPLSRSAVVTVRPDVDNYLRLDDGRIEAEAQLQMTRFSAFSITGLMLPSVYFSVARKNNYFNPGFRIDFDRINSDSHRGWEKQERRYRCPFDGVYVLSVSIGVPASSGVSVTVDTPTYSAEISRESRVHRHTDTLTRCLIALCRSGEFFSIRHRRGLLVAEDDVLTFSGFLYAPRALPSYALMASLRHGWRREGSNRVILETELVDSGGVHDNFFGTITVPADAYYWLYVSAGLEAKQLLTVRLVELTRRRILLALTRFVGYQDGRDLLAAGSVFRLNQGDVLALESDFPLFSDANMQTGLVLIALSPVT